ncbi:MAG: dockerin type I repeat-containing protein, partial [Bacteroidales bacterium]|nr:dockerin type I repeat-containing protein [Bacteroidales bacterium]
YFYGLYWPWDANSDPDYLPLDIDYQTGDVTLNYYHLLRDDTISSNAGGRNRNDTIRREFLVSETYFLNEEPTDCKGTLYEDGSIVFQDNYVYYGYQTINIYISNQLMGTQTEEFVKVYIGTEILAANGMHTFSLEKNGPTYSCNVHMFQNETNDTLFVGNLWELGMPDVILTIDEDANMHYNCISETENGKTYYNPIWDVNDAWISIGFGWFYGISDYTHPTSNIHWGFEGKVTPETITWDHSTLYNGYYIYNDSYNNVLTWLDDSEFRIPEGSTPITNIRGDVNNNGEVDIYDIITLIDYLRCIESDESSGISLECADCNQDGIIDWNDVTSIYNYLEIGAWSE